jgi:aspartyl-tRNA(Asn)/glutamyl-tRNA(Gln) amidotransferase subunit A
MSSDDDLAYLGIAQAQALFKSRKLSPVELAEALIRRAEALDPLIHAFVTPTPEIALQRARDAEQHYMRGDAGGYALAGIPYGLKDIIGTAGVRTTGQSRIFEHHVPESDSEVERRLKSAGGVLLGKLTTYELAHGGPSWDLPWPPAMNPWKKGRLPGNTSSGAGAALAAGFLPAAIGSDTGGSIRMPAAICGVVGMKPTFGSVSRRGVFPNTPSFDMCGPMARSVEDTALLLNVISGHDPLDHSSVDRPGGDFTATLRDGVKGMRIGWVRHWYDGDKRCHPDVAPAVAAAIRTLQDQGAIVEEVELSGLLVYQDCKTTISIAEMFTTYEHQFRTRPQDFGMMFRNKVLSGSLISAEDYVQATRQRLWLAQELARAFADFDVLATAGWMTVADPADPNTTESFLRPPNITTPFNIGGQPSMCLPCGFSREGLPLSLQLAARPFADATMLRAAYAYESAVAWRHQRPTEGLAA